MAYFTGDAQGFLRELAAHNEKPWFEANKARFEAAVQQPALRFIEDASQWLEMAGLPYGAEAKKSGGGLSRIYRDVRFSNDKTPYAEHMIIHFGHKAGSKTKLMPVIGIRFDGRDVGFGGGIYGGQTHQLNQVRDAIIGRPNAWKTATKGLALWGDQLKTAPKGYDKEHPLIDDIRRKQFMAGVPLTLAQFTGDLMDAFQTGAARLQPFLEFIADALE